MKWKAFSLYYCCASAVIKRARDWWYDDSGARDFSSLEPSYVFTESLGRGTTLEINTEHGFFHLMTPDRDSEIRIATSMKAQGGSLTIRHADSELRMFARAMNSKLDFCRAHAQDLQTYERYWLTDEVGTED